VAAVLMLCAGNPRIPQFAGKPAFRDSFHVTGAAAQDIDAMAVQHVYGTLSHVSGQHQSDAFFGKGLGNIGFAAATGRRGDLFFQNDFLSIINCKNREILTVSEVFVNLVVVRWQGDFHIFLLLKVIFHPASSSFAAEFIIVCDKFSAFNFQGFSVQ